MSAPENENAQAWKKQVAVFGGAVSALIGIGIILVVFFTSRDETPRPGSPTPTPLRTEK